MTLRQSALNLLANREHSEAELFRKLTIKNYPPDDIQQLIQQLRKENLVSNTRFIESYINYRRNRGYGPLRIRMELLERGLTEDFIEHHLNITDNAWLTHVRTVWQKRFKNTLPRDFKSRAQQLRFLQYRGFTHAQINCIFKNSDE